MGFFKDRKIARLIADGMEHVDRKNYWEAIRILQLATDTTSTEYAKLERKIAFRPLTEQFSIWNALGGEGRQLLIFFAAACYGLVLAYLGLGEKKRVEENIANLRSWDRKFAEKLKETLQKGETPQRRYVPSDYTG